MTMSKKSKQVIGEEISEGMDLPPRHIKMLELQEEYRKTGSYSIKGLRTILGDPNYSIKIGANEDILQEFRSDDAHSD